MSNYNQKWDRDDAKREDVQNRYTGAFVDTKSTDGVDPTLKKMIGDWSGRIVTNEESSAVLSMCAGCGRKIDTGIQYVNHQNKKYHKECYNVDVKCGRCNKPVFGEVIAAIDKNWHSACFHCSRCNVKLTDKFVERNGDPYCTKCGNEPSMTKTTIVSKPAAAEKNADVQKRNDAAQELFQNAQKGKVVCVECARVIGADENGGLGFAWSGLNYHTQCFKCSKCQQSLQNKGVTSTDSGDLVCEDCHTGAFRAKPLDGKWITVGQHKYHSACFVCDKCRAPLDGGYVEKDNQKLHPSCNTTPTLTKTPVASTQHRGFTVDPRTGQKKFTTGGQP